MRLRVLGEEHSDTMASMNNLALALNSLGQSGEATEWMIRGLEISTRVLGEEHPDTLISMNNLGSFLTKQGQPQRAEPILARSVELHRKVMGDDFFGTGFTLSAYARCLSEQDRFDEAEQAFLGAERIFAASFGPEHRTTLEVCEGLAALYERWGRPAEASRWRNRLPADEALKSTTPQ
jgi:tetratricopeptide (TPR) repeat protein